MPFNITYLLITYLAGALTILSPCILPVLPFVFSRAQQTFVRGALPLFGGLILTFTGFSALAIVGGQWLTQANEWGRVLAMILLSVFALSMIFPRLSEKLVAPLVRFGSVIGQDVTQGTVGGSFVIGVSTGFLWAPCAGPILGLVLTGAAAQGNVWTSIGLLLAYSLGAVTSLSLALVAGNRFFGQLKKFLKVDQFIKKGIGVLVLLGVFAIAFHLDQTVLTKFSKLETTSLENSLLSLVKNKDSATASLLDASLPEFPSSSVWLNSKPLTKADLHGKVVLIDFWTYSCINCLRTLPYVKGWAEKYKNDDFVVIGVHTPEFAFEKNIDNVKKAIQELGIAYPVVIDSDYKIWNSFGNEYWPAHYFIDRQGHVRDHHFGEGQYDESEKIIRELLAENGNESKLPPMTETSDGAKGVQAEGSSLQDLSPETYLGYERAEDFASPSGFRQDVTNKYEAPANLEKHHWALEGPWVVSEEKIFAPEKKAKIVYRFHARDLHLVLGTAANQSVHFKVSLDGHSPGKDHGLDTDANGNGVVNAHRLYQLIRQSDIDSKTDHVFEIEFLDPGVEAFAFTFG